ncbi:MAG TPA: AbrB family transcriptional regulator [Candidatus Binatia bacterium]|nr:AbrB family transcriptional regulator [Candidatus Binatia bacterium]
MWILLVAAAVAAAFGMQYVAMPAPWMIGPLIAGIAFACAGVHRRLPRSFFIAAQAVIGCLFAQAFTPTVVGSLASHFPAMFVIVLLMVAVTVFCGWALSRISSLPPMTAAFGSTPGNAAAMIAMSADFGADPRIVAFMQYIRVILVIMTASLVTRFVFHDTVGANPLLARTTTSTLGTVESYGATLVIAVVGVLLARRAHLPSPNVIGPMALGATLSGFNVVHLALPLWILDAAYLAVGLSIGLLFTVAALKYVFSILPQLLTSTVLLVVLCAVLAAAWSRLGHIDPFTAYLATSPGGLDSVAIIAFTGGGDVPVVLSSQVLRLFVVALLCPSLARYIGRMIPSPRSA